MNGLHLNLVEWKKDGSESRRQFPIDFWDSLYHSLPHCADWYPNKSLLAAEVWLKEDQCSESPDAILLWSWIRP